MVSLPYFQNKMMFLMCINMKCESQRSQSSNAKPTNNRVPLIFTLKLFFIL